MSAFIKKPAIIIGSIGILYIFTCSTIHPFFTSNKTINHDKIVAYVLEEVTFEMTYGDPNIDIDAFVDTAIKEALLNK